MATSLLEQQIRQYEEEGFLVLNELLDESDCACARQAMEQKVETITRELLEAGELQDAHATAPFETRLALIFAGKSNADFLRYGAGWRDRLPGYFHFMSNAKVLDVIEGLIGPEIFSNPVYNVRPKVPGVAAGAVPWHQDRSYWPGANANPVITAWIPLVDATLENGCLHIIPRTHRKNLLEHGTDTYPGTGYTKIDTALFHSGRVVPLPVRAGSVILFNDRAIHMSTPNNSSGVRWSVDLRYQPTGQDPMPEYGAGFLARSHRFPERVARLEDWMAGRAEHAA